MLLELSTHTLEVHEPDDFRQVVLRGVDSLSEESLDRLLASGPIARRSTADPRHVWVSVDALRAGAQPASADPRWLERLEALLALAARGRWLTPDGAFLRADVAA